MRKEHRITKKESEEIIREIVVENKVPYDHYVENIEEVYDHDKED